MAELLGRVERLATNTAGQQQINGQAQVSINNNMFDLLILIIGN